MQNGYMISLIFTQILRLNLLQTPESLSIVKSILIAAHGAFSDVISVDHINPVLVIHVSL